MTNEKTLKYITLNFQNIKELQNLLNNFSKNCKAINNSINSMKQHYNEFKDLHKGDSADEFFKYINSPEFNLLNSAQTIQADGIMGPKTLEAIQQVSNISKQLGNLDPELSGSYAPNIQGMNRILTDTFSYAYDFSSNCDTKEKLQQNLNKIESLKKSNDLLINYYD